MPDSVVQEVSPPNTPSPTSHTVRNILLVFSFIFAALIGGVLGYFSHPLINSNKQILNIPTGEKPKSTEQNLVPTETKTAEKPFCKEYGTYQVNKIDLFEQYTVGPGETLRDIAKKKLNDETKAVDFITINPQLISYEIDDVLPIGRKIYIPNEKYDAEGIVSYLKVKGNIAINQDKSMFGVSSPNSNTGSFLISDKIKEDMKNIKEGDCVTVVYGSRSIGSEFVIFEVKPQ